uniref:Sulfotransferase n=1 Tax=Solanum lycopersicum TaxID=4081 RepID=A0A3Q7GGA9_SOLLC
NRKKCPIFKQDHTLLVKNPHDLVPFLELKLYIDGQVPDFSSFTSPRLLATHMSFGSLPKSIQDSREIKLVYLCRNPRDQEGELLWSVLNHVLDYWKERIEKLNNKVLKKLLYLNVTRPDIAFATQTLSQFLHQPKQSHLNAALKVVRYIKNQAGQGVLLSKIKAQSKLQLKRLTEFLKEVNRNGKLSFGEESKVFFRGRKVED